MFNFFLGGGVQEGIKDLMCKQIYNCFFFQFNFLIPLYSAEWYTSNYFTNFDVFFTTVLKVYLDA